MEENDDFVPFNEEEDGRENVRDGVRQAEEAAQYLPWDDESDEEEEEEDSDSDRRSVSTGA